MQVKDLMRCKDKVEFSGKQSLREAVRAGNRRHCVEIKKADRAGKEEEAI